MLTIVFFLLLLFAARGSEFQCLVSKSEVTYNSTNFYYYPINVFASKSVYEQEKGRALPCHAEDGNRCGNATCNLCPVTKSFCPLAKENVIESLHRTSRLARASLCIFKEKLMNKSETVNVYVAGGSVTVGSLANGCCPADGCNPLKPEFNSVPCTWSYRFTEWMNATYPAKVNFYNMAGHGQNSVLLVDGLARAIMQARAGPFTSNDLILLDHSVNDNGYGGFAVEHGQDMLIRKIYHHSMPHSLPSIVILDADPNPYHGFKQYPYYQVYEKVGKHYDIPVWSYRDSVLSNFSNVNQSDYANYVNMVMNSGRGTHPGWPVHLFMADLYAGIFVSDTDQLCTLDNVENRVMYDAQVKMRSRTFADLPTPLSANSTSMCDKELLALSHDSIKHNLSPVGSYRFEPALGGWNLTVDKVGRMGGFIVDKSAPESSKVIFSLDISTKEFVENQMKFQIIIHYLRSYENAGVVGITMCRQEAFRGSAREQMLDALWTDFPTNRYSLPDKWSPELVYFPYSLCNNFTEDRPTIELSFMPRYEGPRANQKFKLLSIKVCRVEDK